MARMFSRSSSVSLAPRLGIRASICAVKHQGRTGIGEAKAGGEGKHTAFLSTWMPRSGVRSNTCANINPVDKRGTQEPVTRCVCNVNLLRQRIQFDALDFTPTRSSPASNLSKETAPKYHGTDKRARAAVCVHRTSSTSLSACMRLATCMISNWCSLIDSPSWNASNCWSALKRARVNRVVVGVGSQESY